MTSSNERSMSIDFDELRNRVASLVVLGDQISATELRELIGLEPDEEWNQGDSVGRTGRGRRPFTGWSIDAAGISLRPESAIADLLDRVAAVKENIATAAGDPRVRSVSLWVWSADRTFALELPPSHLGAIAGLGATLKIDVYDGDADG